MAKTIIKELIIVLLLAIALVLVLGIFLYDYIPTNKVVPKIEQYQVPNSIKEELEATANDIEEEKTKIVYEIDGTDLKNYEKTNDYEKGKANPFQSLTEQTTNNGNGEASASNSNTDGDTNSSSNGETNTNKNTNTNESNTTTNSNSVGNYLPNTGTK